MGAVEQFFGASGWTLVALGLASCLIPHFFRRGVVAMLCGDFCLFLGIVMPRTFMGMAFFQGALGRQGYRSAGIAAAAALFALLAVPPAVRAWRRRKAAAEEGQGEAAGDGSEDRADPSIFTNVRLEENARGAATSADGAVPAGAGFRSAPAEAKARPGQGAAAAGSEDPLKSGSEDPLKSGSEDPLKKELFGGLGKGDRLI
ncbi:MAG: hypothetical protein ACI4NA_01940 [Succinivibrio sp.]